MGRMAASVTAERRAVGQPIAENPSLFRVRGGMRFSAGALFPRGRGFRNSRPLVVWQCSTGTASQLRIVNI